MLWKDTPLGELAVLLKNPSHYLSVPLYDKRKGRRKKCMKNKKKNKYTLNQIGDMVVEIKDGLKQVNTRLDYIVKVNNLKDLSKTTR